MTDFRVFLLTLSVLTGVAAGAAAGETHEPGTVRAQVDSVGFAITVGDFREVLAASLEKEGLPADFVSQAAVPAVAAILPHDDYLYAGRTAVHALPYLQAKRWVVFGVCHACRRIGVRDRILMDTSAEWLVAGTRFRIDSELSARIAREMGDGAAGMPERHAAEHSIEALLPWLGAAVDDPLVVPILVPGMEPDRLAELAGRVGEVLAQVCRERGWQPGRDLGVLISADAVHYGCEGWGSGGYDPFGCDAAGHEAARGQDVRLCEQLAGLLTDAVPTAFIEAVWDREHPDYPVDPYRITWCGLYSIPFGLTAALRWHEELDMPPPAGRFLRYGDSVTDGRLEVPDAEHLGVTAPNTLQHWVGYPALVYIGKEES